ncbi:MAG TPA: hypothetical protein VMD91_09450 [Candidatus Sulfotelmatobacter sp.]|nr:hypothetical protein [Candidatus Sulfotelmatobacter sp.]
MLTNVVLAFASVCLVTGFVILIVTVRLPPVLRAQRAGATVLVVLGLAAASGALFWFYGYRVQSDAMYDRLVVYDKFSALPRIDRLAQSHLRVDYENADQMPLSGTIWLTVDVRPTDGFFDGHPGDRLWLKMHVSTPGFGVTPVLDETQPLPNDVVTFAWILQANQGGDQVLNVHGVVFRTDRHGRIFDRSTVVNAMRSIDVKAPLSFANWSPVIVALIGLLGTGALQLLVSALQHRAPAHTAAVPAAGEAHPAPG